MGYYDDFEYASFADLKGKTISKIEGLELGSEEAIFECTDGSKYRLIYHQDCCAHCSIEDIAGDVADLLNSQILMAEEVSNSEPNDEIMAKRRIEYETEKAEREAQGRTFYYDSFEEFCSRYESETWTFYKLATLMGHLTIRWYGSSNGYYSERATFEKFKN